VGQNLAHLFEKGWILFQRFISGSFENPMDNLVLQDRVLPLFLRKRVYLDLVGAVADLSREIRFLPQTLRQDNAKIKGPDPYRSDHFSLPNKKGRPRKDGPDEFFLFKHDREFRNPLHFLVGKGDCRFPPISPGEDGMDKKILVPGIGPKNVDEPVILAGLDKDAVSPPSSLVRVPLHRNQSHSSSPLPPLSLVDAPFDIPLRHQGFVSSLGS
jgi:hypothetical protein